MSSLMSKKRAKRAGGVLAGLGVGALGGFVAGLLRKRPLTSYTRSLNQPLPSDDADVDVPAASPPPGGSESR
jgi:hypothetical protein